MYNKVRSQWREEKEEKSEDDSSDNSLPEMTNQRRRQKKSLRNKRNRRQALPKALLHNRHPFRLLVTGRSKSGKTTQVVQMIMKLWVWEHWDDLYIFCPTYDQSAYNRLRPYITKHFKTLSNEAMFKISKRNKANKRRTLIIIDDCSNQQELHEHGRKGIFDELCNNGRHYNISIIVVTQNIKSISPSLRENAEGLMIFQSLNKPEIDTFLNERNTENGDVKAMRKVYFDAIRGPHDFLFQINDSEQGMLNYRNYDELLTGHSYPKTQDGGKKSSEQ